MRLIDADAEISKLKDEIEHEKKTIKIYRGSGDAYDKYICNSAKGKISFLQQKIDFLKKCKTAYDAEKVVEQLDSYYEEEDEQGCYIPERIRMKVYDIVKGR